MGKSLLVRALRRFPCHHSSWLLLPSSRRTPSQIRLLVQEWRSQGKRVLVCAASAKAARLIGGHTVHHANKLKTN